VDQQAHYSHCRTVPCRAAIFPTAHNAPPFTYGADGDLAINATKITVPVDGSRTTVELQHELITDNTRAQPYTRVVFTQTTYSSTPITGFPSWPTLFSIVLPARSLPVESLVISKPHWSYVMSSVGGIASAAFGLIFLLFAQSGFLNEQGQETYIFKFLPTAWRREMLKDAPPAFLIRAEDRARFRAARAQEAKEAAARAKDVELRLDTVETSV